MGRSPGFGSTLTDMPCGGALFGLGFPAAPSLKELNLPANVTRRFILQKARRHPAPKEHRASTACRRRVSGSLSLPSRGAFHLSLTVLFSIGHWVVFRLGGWSPRLPTGFLVSRGTLDSASRLCISFTRLSRSPVGFPTPFNYALSYISLSEPRKYFYSRFGLFRFRSPLLTESLLISLPRPT